MKLYKFLNKVKKSKYINKYKLYKYNYTKDNKLCNEIYELNKLLINKIILYNNDRYITNEIHRNYIIRLINKLNKIIKISKNNLNNEYIELVYYSSITLKAILNILINKEFMKIIGIVNIELKTKENIFNYAKGVLEADKGMLIVKYGKFN